MTARAFVFAVAAVATVASPVAAEETAESFYSEGVAALQKGDPTAAASAFAAALRRDETVWVYWNGFGLAKAAVGDAGGARAAFERAAELAPGEFDPYLNLGKNRLDAGDYGAATVAYGRAVAVRADAAAYYGLGWAMFKAAYITEAVAAFESACEVEPGRATYWRALGEARAAAGDDAGTEKALTRAAALDEADYHVWVNLGTVRRRLGDAAGAATAYNRALALQPDDLDVLLAAAQTALDAGDVGAAASYAERAAALQPDGVAVLKLKAALAERRGDKAAAAACYEQLIGVAPQEFYYQRLFAFCLEGGEWEKAERFLAAWPKEGRSFATAALALGNARRQAGDADGALAAYERAQKADPSFYESWYNAALVWIGRKDYDAALVALARASEVAPERGPAWFKTAEIYAARGAREDALACLARAVAADAAYKAQARASQAFTALEGDDAFLRLVGD